MKTNHTLHPSQGNLGFQIAGLSGMGRLFSKIFKKTPQGSPCKPSAQPLAALMAMSLLASAASFAAPTVTATRAGLPGDVGSYSDSSVAVGNTTIIQLVQKKYLITRRLGPDPALTFNVASGKIYAFANIDENKPVAQSDIIWDPSTKRFYFTAVAGTNNSSILTIGWSKTDSPTADVYNDWCRVQFTYTDHRIVDLTIGDSANKVIIGFDRYDWSTGRFVRSELMYMAKPAAGTACTPVPTPSITNLTVPGGARIFAPAPANQIDNSTTTYLIGIVPVFAADGVTPLPMNQLGLIEFKEDAVAGAKITSYPISVGTYDFPPTIKQLNGPALLGAFGSNVAFAQAVLSKVPRNSNRYSLFTQHTIKNGSNAAVRWYEIDPVSRSLIRNGTIVGSNFSHFNSAISSDRAINGSVATGGNNMVIVSTYSGASFTPRLMASSSINGAPTTSTTIATSSFANNPPIACGSGCPWGGASATPDPLDGSVWVSEQLPTAANGVWNARVYDIKP